MKPEYTYEDLLILGSVTDHFLGYEDQSYYKLMKDHVIKDTKNVLDAILEFLGNYLLSAPKNWAYEAMKDFLFREDLHEFPLYINNAESDGTLWKVIIARWRLQIGK